MAYRQPFSVGEFYHCYNRGVDKRRVFNDKRDYERFLSLLYVSNGLSKNVQISDRNNTSLYSILTNSNIERGSPLVSIEAYALMPNHVHFVFQEGTEKGITTFMQRVFTGYTMYFNKKYQRAGALFAGPFKSRHIADDRYLKQVVPYVLLNPIELFEPKWKTGIGNVVACAEKLSEYPYSSLPDFLGQERLENKIIGGTVHTYYDNPPSLKKMLKTAKEYYREHQGSL